MTGLDILPRFFVIGAAKSATTTVCHYLARHPQVCFSRPKEPHFFSNNDNYRKGFERYQSCFDIDPYHRVVGEGSASYTISAVFPHTVGRLQQYYPDGKFIYIVRHPIDRIRSHVMQAWSDGKAPSSWNFEKVVENVPDVVDPSRYWTQLSRWVEAFGEDKIHIEFYESVTDDLRSVLLRVCSFIDVEPGGLPRELDEARNVSSEKRALNPLVYRLGRVARMTGLRWSSMPRGTKQWLNKLPGLSHAYPNVDVWNSPVLPWLIGELKPEAEQLLSFAGMPVDYWSWEGVGETGSRPIHT